MLPVATTTISVLRQVSSDPDAEEDLDSETDYSPETVPFVKMVSNLRAVISQPSGQRQFLQGGEREKLTFPFKADVPRGSFRILGDDQILDEGDGAIYVVAWARVRDAMGYMFTEGECYQVTGE